MTSESPAIYTSFHSWVASLCCPECRESLPDTDLFQGRAARCVCGFSLSNPNGIWRALTPEGAERFDRFMDEYGSIRWREGRGSPDDAYYLALPFEDLTGRNSWQWSIRAKTYSVFLSEILSPLERRVGRPLDLLDIGAGNGWFSHRLALRGHRCIAIDLVDNDWDGLGATPHYLAHLQRPFVVMQAEMDRLPFADRQFDLAVFNASFHYSTDYARTLNEALRCLRQEGQIAILDTAYYHRDESGRAMVRERETGFNRQYGFKSNSIPALEYLTRESLEHLGHQCGVRWTELRPWYGFKWALRPLKARLLGRREPSKFYIFWGQPK